jgi:hypothetical protein
MVINIRKVAVVEATFEIGPSTMEFAPRQHPTSVGVSSDPGDYNESV